MTSKKSLMIEIKINIITVIHIIINKNNNNNSDDDDDDNINNNNNNNNNNKNNYYKKEKSGMSQYTCFMALVWAADPTLLTDKPTLIAGRIPL